MVDEKDKSGDGAERDRNEHEELIQLASVAAHQLKSPLNTIQTVLSTIVGGFLGPIDPRQRQLLEKAVLSCNSSMQLVSQLLRLRSLDEVTEDQLIPVNLVTAFESAADRVRETARLKNIDFVDTAEISDPLDEAWLRGDAGVVEEVLHVLLDNAVKYTPRQGRVTTRVWLEGGTGDEPATLFFEVVDTGIGIPPQAYEKLFTEFFRATNAKAMSKSGTGLGLAFAARAASVVGGKVHLEPAASGGVRAVASFPRCPECAAEQRRRRLAEGGGVGPSLAEEGRQVTQRVVVVGGVAAGSKVAAKLVRLDPNAEVTVVERGRALSYAGCGLPYYISGVVADQRDLMSTPLGEERDSSLFHDLRNIRTLDLTEAVQVTRTEKIVEVRSLVDGSRKELPYDKLVLATGASAVIPELEGVELPGIHTLEGVRGAEAIKRELAATAAKDVVIVGGGLLGCEITEAIAVSGSRISLIEAQPSILGLIDPDLGLLVQQYMEAKGVRVITGVPVEAFEGLGGGVEYVRLSDGRRIPCDFVILTAGVRPNTELATDCGLDIGLTGAIKTDDTMRTSDPDIYAVGDCSENCDIVTGRPTWWPMGSIAVKEARVAAINICGGTEYFRGIVNSTVLKIFDWTVARTGLDEGQARRAGFDPVVSLIPSLDSAHYIPTSRPILLKMVADRRSGRLLGAQGVGEGKIDKRIDIVATALTTGMTVDEFSHLDFGFAPPYGLAMDSLHAAANVIRNKRDGLFEGIPAAELQQKLLGDEPPFLLDVRAPAVYEDLRLAGSVNIPLGSLRGRLHEVPRGRELAVISRTGLKSYEAALILHDRGYESARVLDGGLEAWPYEIERL